MHLLSFNEIQNTELNILLKLQEVCKQNNLKVYLTGGTLLGAIRHKGFIPWDDDIDVCMPRPDYIKLIELCNDDSVLGKDFKLISYEDNILKLPFAKMVDCRTQVEPQGDSSLTAIWIDIFPVEGLPESDAKAKKHLKKAYFYRQLLFFVYIHDSEWKKKGFLKRSVRTLIYPFGKLYGINRCNKKLVKIATKYSYEESTCVGTVTWGLHILGEKMGKEEFEQSIDVEFEGHTLQTFSCYDKYLRNSYGDYMTPPPEEKRINHSFKAWIKGEDAQ